MSGLEDGEDVVTVGQASLKQDSRVTVINRPENDETAVDPEASDTEQRLSENATTD